MSSTGPAAPTGLPGRSPARPGAGSARRLAPELGRELGRELVRELTRAAHDLRAQARAAGPALRSGSRRAWTLLALWVVGIVGDATTTVLMMRTGRFEEANVAAAGLMQVLGVDAWVVLSSVVCAAIASLSLARPRSTYAWAAAGVAVLVCLGKLWTTASNALLWWTAS